MPEFLLIVLRTFVVAVRSRRDLALENLVFRHQLQVALRTNRRSITSSGRGARLNPQIRRR
jgi:hypothetical protein